MRLLPLLLLCSSFAKDTNFSRRRGGRTPHGIHEGAFELTAHVIAPDVFATLPRTFLPNFKTPCWDVDGKLSCLPYYYLLGVFQCGVVDFHSRMSLHPLVARTHMMHFWDEKRTFESYQSMLGPGIEQVRQNPREMVLGDSSFSHFTYTWSSSDRITIEWTTAFKRCREESCQLDRTCIERICYSEARAAAHPLSGGGVNLTLPWLVRAAHGEHARFIVLLRDPVERFHSAFWMYAQYTNYYGHFNRTFMPVEGAPPASEKSFTEYAIESVEHLERCLKDNTQRECFEAFEALSARNEQVFYHCDQLLKSMHSHWMAGWLEAFDRSSFLVLRLEDVIAPGGMERALKAVFKHLELPPVSEMAMREILAAPVKTFNTQPRHPGKGQIEPAARERLRAFFRPYNRRLAAILGDDAFKFGY
jgi:N-acetylgalactosamine 4-sulfate 6-O-sulfotransferase